MSSYVIRRMMLASIFMAALALSAASAHAQTPPNVTKIATNGFGDQGNGYSWSMQWFKGKLYVGTARYQYCVEGATLDFYFPNQGYYSEQPTPDQRCPKDRYDLDLRAEIWQYTPSTDAWLRVFQSPADIPNPRAPGKFVARDIGFRGMVVHKDSTGVQALYVGGVTAGEYIPELAQTNPPRLLRTTDGTSFTALAGAPAILNTAFGPQKPIGYRAMEEFAGRLFVTASGGLLGDGVMIEVDNPSSAAPTFTQVSPVGMQIFEMEVFDGHLYVGTGDARNGYSVFKTKATGSPYSFQPIVTAGAGRGALTTSVVSMHPYKGRLYIGASGWYGTTAQSELIRVNTDDTWDLVVGNARIDFNLQFRYPISGLPDGFGNPANAHFWRQQEHQGELQVGTNDWSWSMRSFPGAPELFEGSFGFDIYGSCDGASWYGVTANAFDDGLYNFGARTMASSSEGRFYGSANHAAGTSVWRQTGLGPCPSATTVTSASTSSSSTSSSTTSSPAPLQPPRTVQTEMGHCGAALAWKPSAGATRYSIMRSEYRPADVPGVVLRPALPNGLRFDPLPSADGLAKPTAVIPPQAPVIVGSTTTTSFADLTAKPHLQYLYRVVAEDSLRRSMPTLALASPAGPLQSVTGLAVQLLPVIC